MYSSMAFCSVREWVDSASRGSGSGKQLNCTGPVGRQSVTFGLTECFVRVLVFWRNDQRGAFLCNAIQGSPRITDCLGETVIRREINS